MTVIPYKLAIPDFAEPERHRLDSPSGADIIDVKFNHVLTTFENHLKLFETRFFYKNNDLSDAPRVGSRMLPHQADSRL